jgi:fused signal recognition particle receptor
MFDGLKDKLSGFREDVDEAAEEVDEDEATATEETPGEGGDVSGTPSETEAAGEGKEAEDGGSGGAGLADKARTLVGERAFYIDEGDLDAALEELELALLSSDVDLEVARDLLERVEDELVGEKRHWRESPDEVVADALRSALVDVLSVDDGLDFDAYVESAEKPVTVIFTGVNGVGKTTTIAKIAERLEQRGYSSVLANGDTFRAGANQQLAEHGEALDKKVITHEQGGDPAAVIYDAVEYAEANDVDVVLGDTAGRLHTSSDLMDQLAKIERVVEPDLTVYVDEAVAGQDAIQRAREFDEAAPIDGVVLTKADADSDGGAALSIAHVTGTPILFLGTGQDYGDLDAFDPERIADDLLD